MRTFGRSIAFLALLVQVLVPASAAGQEAFESTAGTVVDDSAAPIVTVTVNIDLVVPDPSGKGKEMADGIAQQIMDYWNLEFEKLSTDCLQWNRGSSSTRCPNRPCRRSRSTGETPT